MKRQEVLEIVHSENFSKPEILTHAIQNWAALPAIEREGLRAMNRYDDINAMTPNRPTGVFFWNASEMRGNVRVRVSDLDISNLYAFPSILAQIVNAAIVGHEVEQAALEVAREFVAVPFSEYDGSFAAEWIYTSEIPANLLVW